MCAWIAGRFGRMYMRTFIEIVAVLIFLIIIGTMQAKDEASKQEQARMDLVNKCQIQQHNELHVFDCRIIDKHLARIDYER